MVPQVVKLVQDKTFSPRPIKRELRSILNLFEKRNFDGVNSTEGSNSTANLVCKLKIACALGKIKFAFNYRT